MSVQTRISTKKSSSLPVAQKYTPPPVLQPKTAKKPDAQLPEWKPGGSGAASPLQRLIDSKAAPVANTEAVGVVQRLQSPVSESPQQQETVQREADVASEQLLESPVQRQESSAGENPENNTPNRTGLPAQLKAGVENLSGYSLDDVKVHYNSPEPAQLKALAYTKGTDIHVAPGQEQHLPHEAWHVVQQKQGRVKGTKQAKGNELINDDPGLEREADMMGAKAIQRKKGEALKNLTEANGKQKSGHTGRLKELTASAGSKRLVLKIVLAGSGDYIWRTNDTLVKAAEKERPDRINVFKKSLRNKYSREIEDFITHKYGTLVDDKQNPVHRIKELSDGHQITIVGPGGKGARGNSLGGIFDKGSNTIAKNKEFAKQWVEGKVFEHLTKNGGGEIIILIKGHSRNAVAATQIANYLADYLPINNQDVKLNIELAAYDPVPGPSHEGLDTKIKLNSRIHSTVVLSVASGKIWYGFTPQMVLGADRVIITDHDHHAGMVDGYEWEGKIYTGSNLNSLPKGLYMDQSRHLKKEKLKKEKNQKPEEKNQKPEEKNQKPEEKNQHGLQKMESVEAALNKLFKVYWKKGQIGDTGRLDKIREVIRNFRHYQVEE